MVQSVTEAQKLIQDSRVSLLTITRLDGTSYRFTNSTRSLSPLVQHNSLTYLPRRFSLGARPKRANGSLPRPSLEIDNVDRFWYSILQETNQLRRASVLYQEVYRQHLDDGSDPQPAEFLTSERFVVFEMKNLTQSLVAFTLAQPMDVEQAMFGRQMLRQVCARTYRAPGNTADTFIDRNNNPGAISCPYDDTGDGNYYKRDGTPTSNWREDACGQRLSDCRLRFGDNNNLPYWGHPSIGAPR